jgi:hypothetical protein
MPIENQLITILEEECSNYWPLVWIQPKNNSASTWEDSVGGRVALQMAGRQVTSYKSSTDSIAQTEKGASTDRMRHEQLRCSQNNLQRGECANVHWHRHWDRLCCMLLT